MAKSPRFGGLEPGFESRGRAREPAGMLVRALAEHPSPEGVTHTVVLTRPDGIQAVVQVQTERSGNAWAGCPLVLRAVSSLREAVSSTTGARGRAMLLLTGAASPPAGVLLYPVVWRTLVP